MSVPAAGEQGNPLPLLAAALHQAALALERKWEDGKLVSCLMLTFATFGKPLMSRVTQDSIL